MEIEVFEVGGRSVLGKVWFFWCGDSVESHCLLNTKLEEITISCFIIWILYILVNLTFKQEDTLKYKNIIQIDIYIPLSN